MVREAEVVGVTTAGAADGPAEGQLTAGPWFPWRRMAGRCVSETNSGTRWRRGTVVAQNKTVHTVAGGPGVHQPSLWLRPHL